MQVKTICFIKPADSTFILTDQEILEKQFKVFPYLLKGKRSGFGFIFTLIRLVWFLVTKAPSSDALVTWFADYHAALITFFGKLFGKKVIIFLGGQEAICYPELKKGVYLKKYRGICVRYAIRHATHLIPNHESLIWHENYYYDPDGKKDGIRYYIPDFKTPYSVIPNGTDTSKFFRDNHLPKNKMEILTVGTMNNLNDFINKGFDLFIHLAERNPDLKFTMAGVNPELMDQIENKYHLQTIKNLEVVCFSGFQTLFQLYNRARVYVQASITEGMPNTLSEAMLCECVPVGSKVNGIPDLIANTGILIEHRNIAELESSVRKALKLETGKDAAAQIRNNFSFSIRENRIKKLFMEII